MCALEMLVGLAKKKVMVAVGPFILLVHILRWCLPLLISLSLYQITTLTEKPKYWANSRAVPDTHSMIFRRPDSWVVLTPACPSLSKSGQAWGSQRLATTSMEILTAMAIRTTGCLITARSPSHDYLVRVRYDKEIEIGEIQDENSFVIKDHDKLIF